MSIKKRTESGIHQDRTELPVGDWELVISVLVSAERRSSQPGPAGINQDGIKFRQVLWA